jgi:phage RecT family recombinase
MTKKQTDLATRDETAPAEQEKQGIVAYLQSIAPKLEEAATRHLTPDRLIRVFLGIAARNPKIHECSRASIVHALSLCSSTGLEPGGVLKLVDLIPRYNKHTRCTELNFQPRYGGLAELALRSGKVSRINASPVYMQEIEQGLFEYSHEPPVIRHEMDPTLTGLQDKDIIGGYAVAELENGQRVQIWLSLDKINKRRQKSQQPNGNFWKEWYPEMVRKTLLRALLDGGLVPRSTELAVAMAHDPDGFVPVESTTAAQRRIQIFRPDPTPQPDAIDTTAEPALPPADETPEPDIPDATQYYTELVRLAREAGASDDELAAAIVEAGHAETGAADFTDAAVDEVMTALERRKGV